MMVEHNGHANLQVSKSLRQGRYCGWWSHRPGRRASTDVKVHYYGDRQLPRKRRDDVSIVASIRGTVAVKHRPSSRQIVHTAATCLKPLRRKIEGAGAYASAPRLFILELNAAAFTP
jgi:hypothetical protein